MSVSKNIKKINKKEAKKSEQKKEFKALTIKTPRAEFQKALSIARDFVCKKSTMPILTHVLVKNKTITVTDLDTAWVRPIPCDGDVARAIPLNILYQEVVALPSDIAEVVLIFEKTQVRINNRVDILTLPADEFPVVPQIKPVAGYKIKVSDLKAVSPAIGQDDTRYTLKGAYLDLEKGRVCGTDGHRLHYNNIAKGKGQYMIPYAALQLMIKHGTDELTLHFAKEHFSIDLSGGVMTSRLIECQFPDIEQVIPKSDMPNRATFKPEDFLEVLEGALPIASKSNSILITFDGDMEISAINSDIGQYKWKIDCKYLGKLSFKIGFNARYLIDAIKSYPANTVTLKMSDPLSPCLINTQAVVMPIRT